VDGFTVLARFGLKGHRLAANGALGNKRSHAKHKSSNSDLRASVRKRTQASFALRVNRLILEWHYAI